MSTQQPHPRKKLIEVALPLAAINAESAREKSIRHGHPSTLHLWWARRPLAACRAVIFASLVDDPSAHPERFPTEADQQRERARLFALLERLVKWENSSDEKLLASARAEIARSCDGAPPPLLDPFCGGGSIPLEAQRLGLEAHASDLNPVAVLITKALIEIPPRFAGRPPVNPDSRGRLAGGGFPGASGLAEDVRYYGAWMREQAEARIGHLYPPAELPPELGGGRATVIAWLWVRTVVCPNPACGAQLPLVRSFALSTKRGKQAWVEPQIDRDAGTVTFAVRTGLGVPPAGTVNRRGARCLLCGNAVPFAHIRGEGRAGRMGARLMAIVAEGSRGRLYLPPDAHHEAIARSARPSWAPESELPHNPRDFKTPNYGMTRHRDLFTDRQLLALTTFSDLVGEAREKVLSDASAAGLPDGPGLAACGPADPPTAASYADAVATYLAFAVDRLADRSSTICSWDSGRVNLRNTFARQAIPMVWDFAEGNPLSGSTGSFAGATEWIAKFLADAVPAAKGLVRQLDATAALERVQSPLVCTDPPYYDNIGYADLSDFFYIWLRGSLKCVYPELFSTLLTPKEQELVATPYRFDGDRGAAKAFFEQGLGRAFEQIHKQANPAYPVTIYYAFKQAESDGDGESTQTASTGWETMLAGLLTSGFAVTGTWPMRSELSNRPVASGTNALASSIVLVCRPRPADAPLATRREFQAALRAELPDALRKLQQGSIAPVDLAQAAIGPGMAAFSRYAKVLEADGSPMTVRSALALINQALGELLVEQEGEFDADTRWAIAWFEQFGMEEGEFGRADVLARAKNTSVGGLMKAGVIEASAGRVRLLARSELSDKWDPAADARPTVWEMVQHVIKRLEGGGEEAAADLARRLGGNAEIARDLAYRLYTICERRKWASEALAYNALVVAWPEISRLAVGGGAAVSGDEQSGLF